MPILVRRLPTPTSRTSISIKMRFLAPLLLAAPICASPAFAGSLLLLHAGSEATSGGGGTTPVLNWINSAAPTGGATSLTTSKGSHTINNGDELIVIGGPIDGSAINHTPFSCQTGFNFVVLSVGNTGTGGSYDVYLNDPGNGRWEDIAACVGVAGVAGVGTGGAYTLSWTTAGDRFTTWDLIDISGQNATPQDDAGATSFNAYVQSFTAPSVSATKSDDLLISAYVLWSGDATDPVTHSPGMTVPSNASNFDAPSEPEIVVLTSTPAIGASGTKNITTGLSASGSGTAGDAFNILAKGL